jgi:hypothetical protein
LAIFDALAAARARLTARKCRVVPPTMLGASDSGEGRAMNHRIGEESGGVLARRVLPGAAALLGLLVLALLLFTLALRAAFLQGWRPRRWERS